MKIEEKLITVEQLAALKPNELIRLGVGCMKLVLSDERYEISMGGWHQPIYKDDNPIPIICQVCMAGAVMAKSLGCDPRLSYSPGFFEGEYVESRVYSASHAAYDPLHAINNFREGDVWDGLETLGLVGDVTNELDRIIVEYAASPDKFFEQMEKLADDLEAAGY